MGKLRQKLIELRSGIGKRIQFLNHTFEGRAASEYLTEASVRRRKIFAHYLYNFLFSILTALTLTQSETTTLPVLLPHVGEAAEVDIISPITAEIEPRRMEKAKIVELERNIPPVFDYDDVAIESWLRRWELGFQQVRQAFYGNAKPAANPSAKKNAKLLHNPNTLPEGLSPKIYELTGQNLSHAQLLFLHKRSFSQDIENQFMEVGRYLNGRLISPANLFPTYYNTGVVVRLVNQSLRETLVHDVSRIWSVEQAREYLNHIRGSNRSGRGADFGAITELVSETLIANLTFNQDETKRRVTMALAASKLMPIVVKRGQVIVQKGERLDEEHIRILQKIRDLTSTSSSIKRFFLSLLVLFVFFSVLFRLNIAGRAFWNLSLKDALVFLAITLVSFMSVKYGLPQLRILFVRFNMGFGVEYLLPITAGAVIIHLMMGKETAFTYATLNSIVFGYLLDQNFYFTVYAFAVMASAIQSIRSCKQRTDLYRCGAWSGSIGALLVLSFSLTQAIGFRSVDFVSIGITVILAFLSGMLSAILTSSLIPVFETVFGYTTSLKLLELSNFNHPLLHNLMMKAPGTYHHSVIVGSLAELAADRIKANSLLARVGSYYHDIGKMTKPLYFIENQAPNSNPHDHLQPSMSAKILFAHVKNGVRMGRDHNLGSTIVNIIDQHHGTTLVSFFFNKAKKTENPDLDHVDEHEFRYPGPKPQTKEAAIVMLADACEAATRSIGDPTAAKIQTMVHSIITKRFLEEQFSDCDITLKDLHTIEECFVRTLVSLYHHRIEYPGQKQAMANVPQPPVSTDKKAQGGLP